MSTADRSPAVRRRAVLAAAAGVVGSGAGAACGAPVPTAPPAPPRALPPPTRTPRPVGRTEDVPVGGGRVYPVAQVVVTQPVAGEFRGFGIVCTHDGCQLNDVSGGTINCPCHGSRFAVTDGSVVRGPARTGLRKERLAIDGDKIVVL